MTSKIYVIGGSGNGKSFLGKKISEKTGISNFDLDDLHLNSSPKERDEELKKILNFDKWVIDGTYTENWIIPILEKSDFIVWLDMPAWLKLFRFFKRTLKGERGGFNDFYGRALLVAGFRYKEFDRSRACYAKLLEPFKSKTVVLKTKREVKDFVAQEKYLN